MLVEVHPLIHCFLSIMEVVMNEPDSPVLALTRPELTADMVSKFNIIVKLHLAAFIFFLIQFIAYVAVEVDVHVTPTIGDPANCNGPICEPELKTLKSTNPSWLIPLFVALACFDHLVCYTVAKIYPETAQYWLFQVGSNPCRWIEYSISASAMAVAISILAGVSDVHLWFSTFTMTAVGMLLGQIVELLPDDEGGARMPGKVSSAIIRKLVYAVASFVIFAPWLIICCYFFRAVSADVPDFVYAAFLGTLVLFITFGANSLFHNILGWYDFPTAEIVYLTLSFTAKTFLAADVWGGLRAQNNDDDGSS